MVTQTRILPAQVLTWRTESRRPSGGWPAPPRPPAPPPGDTPPRDDDDLQDLAGALIALAIVLRDHPAGAVEPDPAAVALARWLVLVSDDCLTAAAGLVLDPAAFNVARAAVGKLPGGADWPPPLEVQR